MAHELTNTIRNNFMKYNITNLIGGKKICWLLIAHPQIEIKNLMVDSADKFIVESS